jgi:NitT/TauT family transport system permease protein
MSAENPGGRLDLSGGAFLRRIKRTLTTNQYVIFLESIGSIVLLWAILSYVFGYEATVSTPGAVGIATYELFVSLEWVSIVYTTLRRIFWGFLIAVTGGTVLGVLMGVSGFWDRTFQDFVTVGLAFPSLFIAVFAAMWFGPGDTAPIVTAAIAPMPFVAQNVYQGVENIDRNLVEMAEAFDVSEKRVTRRIVFQSIMPEWFTGVRYGFAGAWKVVTLAEAVAAGSGVGFMIRRELSLLSLPGVFKWTVLFGIIIMIIEYGLFQQTEKVVFDWREETTTTW